MSEESDNPTRSIARGDELALEALSPKQKVFLKAYGECGVVKYACQIAGIHRSTFYDWRARDVNFKACLPDADADACDTLEFAAYQQSVEGMEEPAISAGQVVYDYELLFDDDGKVMLDNKGKPLTKRGQMVTIRKYSPQLLITLLKARMPEKYRERTQVEHSGSVDVTGAKELLNQKLQALREQEVSE